MRSQTRLHRKLTPFIPAGVESQESRFHVSRQYRLHRRLAQHEQTARFPTPRAHLRGGIHRFGTTDRKSAASSQFSKYPPVTRGGNSSTPTAQVWTHAQCKTERAAGGVVSRRNAGAVVGQQQCPFKSILWWVAGQRGRSFLVESGAVDLRTYLQYRSGANKASLGKVFTTMRQHRVDVCDAARSIGGIRMVAPHIDPTQI